MNENNVTGTGSCWFGRACAEGCDKYKDGKCTGLVHPTDPPKMADCPFSESESCGKLEIVETGHDRQVDPTAVEKAYETIFHLAKVISGGNIDMFQMVHMASAMMSACKAYIDADASNLCSPT